MGILNGTVSCTRFNAAVPPEGPDLDGVSFRAIEPGSEVRERMGFVPYELDAPWEVGARRWAFRVRIDRVKPDPTAVRERLKELVKTEMEQTGRPFVGGKTRKKLRELAEAELALRTPPRTTIVECALDGDLLYVGSAAKTVLGSVLALLRQAGVAAEPKAPWLDEAPEVDELSDVVVPKEPGQSVLGCRFVKAVLDDPDVMIEPETGSVRLATREARVTLGGAVLRDVYRFIEEGAEILAAKLLVGGVPVRFDALSYRMQGAKLEPVKDEHWTIELDRRLEQIAALWELLDSKYASVKDRLGEPLVMAPPEPAPPAEAAVS